MHGMIETDYRVEWRPLAELGSIAAEWQSLSDRALEPNAFLEPAFALAAAPVFGRDVGAGLVWSRAAPYRLMGLFPGRIARRRYGVKLPVLIGWTHPFAPLGTPLIDGDAGAAAISAWLEHLAGNPELPQLLLMPYLPVAGAVAQAFAAAEKALGRGRRPRLRYRARARRDGGGARRFFRARSRRLEGTRRHRRPRRCKYPGFHGAGGHRPRPRRQGAHRQAHRRRPANRRAGHPGKRHHRGVLEARL